MSDGFGPALKPHPTDAGRQIRKPACFGDGRSDQSDRLGNQNLLQEGHGNARQTFFNVGLGSLAGQAVQDHLFPKPLDEEAFQKFVSYHLRQRPEIGTKLEEHPRAAGGVTDLSFERIRLELKSENERPLRLSDCQKFVGQTSSYAAGSDKRVSLLCVLDGSRKIEQPFPAKDGIGILKTGDDAVAVVTVLVQGNLARPSDLSRRAKRRREGDKPGGNGG